MLKYDCTLIFGLPRSGKTTYLAYLANKYVKKRIRVYTNVPLYHVHGVTLIDPADIGDFRPCDGVLLLDEATLDFHSRDFKNFTKQQLEFFNLHGHYKIKIFFFAQSPDTLDKRLREITSRCLYVKKSIFQRTAKIIPIPRGLVFPDGSEKGNITLGYQNPPAINRIFAKRIKLKKYRRFFDSFSRGDFVPIEISKNTRFL